MHASPARTLAAAWVNHVLLDGQSLAGLIHAPHPRHDARDLAAAQNLTYGTLRLAGRLRHSLRQLNPRPLDPAELLGPILVGLYELDSASTPAYAAVNETVAQVASRHPRARGFVNAILRNYQRRQVDLRAAAAQDPGAHWNLPRWWLERLQAAYPDTWMHIAAQLNLHPPMSVRVNRRRLGMAEYAEKLQAAGINAHQTGLQAFTLDTPVPIAQLPGHREGWVSVQDLGAQLAAPLLDAADGMRVLDACAAPGGKTSHLLELHDINLLALDLDANRLRQVDTSLARLGLTARTRVADAAHPSTWWDNQPFDRILLDAPCTASGVIRRHPDARWLKRADDLQHLARTQANLLDALWPLLKPGGKMLYATCSLFPAENDAQMHAFLARRPDAALEHSRLPALDTPNARETQLMHPLPPTPEADGFFYARLVKT